MIQQSYDIVKNGSIDISSELWQQLNSLHTKEEIKKLISDTIDTYNIPLPMRRCTLDECLDHFNDLVKLDSTNFIKEGHIGTRYNGEWYGKYIDVSSRGSKASDYFHENSRWLADSINSPSPYRTWLTEKFRLTLLNGLWTLKFKNVGSKELRSLISLRKYIASQFRPSAAKAIYEYFNAEHILDFSSGWGDRLCAFHACPNTKSYVGIDPNTRLFDGYASQSKLYNTGKQVTMLNNCAESVDISDYEFDFIFTSPPYFTVERYSNEPTQSWKKFKTIDAWLTGFLFPALDKAWSQLKNGGTMAINISDVYAQHKINRICDPMLDHMARKSDSSSLSPLGIKFSKRPQSKAVECKSIFCEPVYIWKKR